MHRQQFYIIDIKKGKGRQAKVNSQRHDKSRSNQFTRNADEKQLNGLTQITAQKSGEEQQGRECFLNNVLRERGYFTAAKLGSQINLDEVW